MLIKMKTAQNREAEVKGVELEGLLECFVVVVFKLLTILVLLFLLRCSPAFVRFF